MASPSPKTNPDLSILLRVESLARLTAQTLLVNFDTLHHPDCEIDSDCKEDQDLISNEIYKHLARQNSYEAVIVGRLNVIDDASNSIEDGCRVKLREFWTAKMREASSSSLFCVSRKLLDLSLSLSLSLRKSN